MSAVKGLHSNGLPARILDVLETDGGWLTTDGVALELGWENTESVYRALSRLVVRGFAEHRQVQLAGYANPVPGTYSGNGVGLTDRRAEWRVA